MHQTYKIFCEKIHPLSQTIWMLLANSLVSCERQVFIVVVISYLRLMNVIDLKL